MPRQYKTDYNGYPGKRGMRFQPGPKPTTARGKRRHQKRSDAQKRHAEGVWFGGY